MGLNTVGDSAGTGTKRGQHDALPAHNKAYMQTPHQICTYVLRAACCMAGDYTLQSSQMLHDSKLHQTAGQTWMMH